MDAATSITSRFDPTLAILAPLVLIAANLVTNYVRASLAPPSWAPPAIAFGVSILAFLILALALGVAGSVVLLAQVVVMSFLTVAGSMAQQKVSESAVAARAEPPTPEVYADLVMARIRQEMGRRPMARARGTPADALTPTSPGVTPHPATSAPADGA